MALLVAILAAGIAMPALAQSYPSKPVRIIVSVPAGGAVDTIARLISARFQEVFGQPFVVENRAGANGNIAAELLAKSAPDGYTIMLGDLGTFTSGPGGLPDPAVRSRDRFHADHQRGELALRAGGDAVAAGLVASPN